MATIQEANGRFTLVMPKHVIKFMGWKKGQIVVVNTDKGNDSINVVRDARHRS